MADDRYTFEQARIRLEEIAVEVRKKDTSLEKSLDLLEEGVRLANICTELVDHTDVGATVTAPRSEGAEGEDADAQDMAAQDAVAGSPAGDARAADALQEVDSGDVMDEPVVDPEAADDEAEGFDEADDEVGEPADAGSDD